MKSYHKNIFLLLSAFALLMVSCRKFVQVDPPITGINSGIAYNSDQSALAVVTSVYGNMMGFHAGVYSVGYLMGAYADETKNYDITNTQLQAFYTNEVQTTSFVNNWWNTPYTQIYTCNSAIAGITSSVQVSETAKNQAIGEAEFSRGYFYFHMTNLFGDIPLILGTDYNTNAVAARTPSAQVYAQVVADLRDASVRLTDDYKSGTGAIVPDRIRPNRKAAQAMLARVYLYQQQYAQADSLATIVINDSRYVMPTDLSTEFLAKSTDAIWQLQPNPNIGSVVPDFAAYSMIPGAAPGPGVPTTLSDTLLKAFEAGDLRFTNWVGRNDVAATATAPAATYYYNNKYKSKVAGTEYIMVLRVAEQYLIRAEARVYENNLNGAAADLNTVRTHAGLGNTKAATQADLLTAIMHERQVELFNEHGHRWFDLKRTGAADARMSIITPLKGGTWSTNWLLLPLPQTELLQDKNLTQNPGYPD